MSCGADCLSLGPPPDSILSMPPPPLPSFLLPPPANLTPPCPSAAPHCPTSHQGAENTLFPDVEYRELPRHVSVAEPASADSWSLVLITCCVAALCLAALLAIFLVKCKDARGGGKGAAAGGALYGGPLDSRVLWAALTPRGTRHFVADPFDEQPVEDHTYECVEPALYKLGPPPGELVARHFDSEYDAPAPLLAGYEARLLRARLERPAPPLSLRRPRAHI